MPEVKANWKDVAVGGAHTVVTIALFTTILAILVRVDPTHCRGVWSSMLSELLLFGLPGAAFVFLARNHWWSS